MSYISSLATILAELESRCIQLSTKGGKLFIDFPPGSRTPEIIDALKQHKANIINNLLTKANNSMNESGLRPKGFGETGLELKLDADELARIYEYQAFVTHAEPGDNALHLEQWEISEEGRIAIAEHIASNCYPNVNEQDQRLRFKGKILGNPTLKLEEIYFWYKKDELISLRRIIYDNSNQRGK